LELLTDLEAQRLPAASCRKRGDDDPGHAVPGAAREHRAAGDGGGKPKSGRWGYTTTDTDGARALTCRAAQPTDRPGGVGSAEAAKTV